MADTDILVSEMTPASQINTTDLMIMTQPDAQAETGYSTKSGTVLQVANKMLKGTEYSTDLPDFTDKTPLGGLEELKSDIKSLLPIATASGNPCNFDTGIADKLVSLKAAILTTGGNGTPSTPIPIVGHSELNLTRCGVNLWDEEIRNGYYNNSGVFFDLATSLANKNPIKVKPDTTYYCYCGSAFQFFVFTYDENGDFISRITTAKNATFTTPANCAYIGWCNGYGEGGTYANDISINSDSADTSYHAYNGTPYLVSFGQTVYGGEYDANAGKVKITHEVVDLGDLGYGRTTSYDNPIFYCNLSATYKGFVNSLCSCYRKIADGSASSFASAASNYDFGYNSNGYGQLFIRNDDYSDANTFQTAMSGQKVTLELATPIEIDVSSISVEAVSGVNNIVSDCGGDVEVQYRDSIQHYIDSKIASVQALIL